MRQSSRQRKSILNKKRYYILTTEEEEASDLANTIIDAILNHYNERGDIAVSSVFNATAMLVERMLFGVPGHFKRTMLLKNHRGALARFINRREEPKSVEGAVRAD